MLFRSGLFEISDLDLDVFERGVRHGQGLCSAGRSTLRLACPSLSADLHPRSDDSALRTQVLAEQQAAHGRRPERSPMHSRKLYPAKILLPIRTASAQSLYPHGRHPAQSHCRVADDHVSRGRPLGVGDWAIFIAHYLLSAIVPQEKP